MSGIKKILKNRVIWWSGLGALSVLLRLTLGSYPALVERYYSRGLFLAIRWLIDTFLSWLPVALIYPFLIWLAFYTGRGIYRLLRGTGSVAQRLKRAGWSLLSFTGAGVFLFLFLWGFNYGRQPIEHTLDLEAEPLKLDELRSDFEAQTARIIGLRRRIPGVTDSALTAAFMPAGLERQLRSDLTTWLKSNGYPAVGRVRARRLFPRGIFLSFSSSGLYFPWVGEGNVDAGLHPLQLPYVMTHEMSHGYGFGDEGTCNFLAYVSCAGSADPFIAYSAELDFWRTLAVNYRRYEPEAYQFIRDSLPAGIVADLDVVNETLLKYPDIMPHLRYAAYDAYLKTQGIEEGMLNYNRVVMLVRAWRKKTQG